MVLAEGPAGVEALVASPDDSVLLLRVGEAEDFVVEADEIPACEGGVDVDICEGANPGNQVQG